MNKPIISTWGLGPSYRDRVKHNLLYYKQLFYFYTFYNVLRGSSFSKPEYPT